MLSAKRSRHRIPIAFVASCLLLLSQPGTICSIVCLSREAATVDGGGHHGEQMTAMPPCHTGNGVRPAQSPVYLSIVALPASGRLVFITAVRPAAVAEPAATPHSAFLELRTPPPRLG
jgi:hypothetical protein